MQLQILAADVDAKWVLYCLMIASLGLFFSRVYETTHDLQKVLSVANACLDKKLAKKESMEKMAA